MKPNHCYLHTTTTENPSYGITNCMVLHEKKEGKKEPLCDFAAPSFFLHKASIKQMLKPWGTALGFPTMTIPQQDPGKHFRTTVPMNAVASEDIRGYSTPLPRYGDLQQTRHYPWPSPASDYERASQWQQVWTLLLLLSHTNMFTFCSVREILIQSQYLRQQERSNWIPRVLSHSVHC